MATPCASGLLTVEPCREATGIESSIAAIESAAARSIATRISLTPEPRTFVVVAPSCHPLRRIASRVQSEIFYLFDEADRLFVWNLPSIQRGSSTPFVFTVDGTLYRVVFVANEAHASALRTGFYELVELVIFDYCRICFKTLATVEAFCGATSVRRAIYVTLSLETDDEAPTGN